jgi:integrase
MVRMIGKLSALTVSKAKTPGKYPDGGGLYLQVSKTGARSWGFRYQRDGREHLMGLGPLHIVSLAEARTKAADCRKVLLEGKDPLVARKIQRGAEALEAAKAMTFSACAELCIASHQAGWRNAKHAAQWKSTLATYAEPVFGALAAQAVDTGLVMKVLEPLWTTKPETASRVRGRIESVLDWATARGYRQGENPARWRGHLDQLLARRSRVRQVKHHAALPYDLVGSFMLDLRHQDGVSARALQFLILTATRTAETIGAEWREFDLQGKLWTVPPERTKSGREHRVPLSPSALIILKEMKREHPESKFVFPGGKRGRPLSNMALLSALHRMERADLTGHGFRSTFRDWAAERTRHPSEAVEMALGHVVSDKTEAAYRRGDLFEKRRRLMDDWARFCAVVKTGGKVVALR